MASKFTICIKRGNNGIGFARVLAFGVANALKTARTIWGNDRVICVKM